MTLRRKPKRLAGDNPILRRAFIAEQVGEFEAHFGTPLAARGVADHFTSRLARGRDDLGEPYRVWLTARGIDPDTGRMTLDGLNFFKALLDADRSTKSRRRRAA